MGNDLQTALKSATAFVREAALMIATMSSETRGVAYHIARVKLGDAIRAEIGDSDVGDQLVKSQMAEVRALVAKIDASGGADGGRA
jgi:hypothetical protein